MQPGSTAFRRSAGMARSVGVSLLTAIQGNASKDRAQQEADDSDDALSSDQRRPIRLEKGREYARKQWDGLNLGQPKFPGRTRLRGMLPWVDSNLVWTRRCATGCGGTLTPRAAEMPGLFWKRSAPIVATAPAIPRGPAAYAGTAPRRQPPAATRARRPCPRPLAVSTISFSTRTWVEVQPNRGRCMVRLSEDQSIPKPSWHFRGKADQRVPRSSRLP